ncbi:uncharacterized protein FIESC28_02720 [Fusarium coffeatum]|uniref:Cytochrome P450 n=1 Tax=Fusarium coffeatum TaxID=231269 RepID=A0A366S5C8_9HYPO|nr:uncharacterized protein FIESC28_02720 [Fusarium coffeatum]RBR24524.1 hypothetical protein FIESC28_02720 [Fusarium coffeatum]
MADTSTSLAVLGIAAIVTLWYFTSSTKGEKKLARLALIGDLHSSPIEKPLLRWDAWAKEKGAIATPKLFGILPMVILNTADASTELLSRRGKWYSNRPSSVSMEMISGAGKGQSRFTVMHDMDAHLKLHQRILSPSLGVIAAPRYQPVMELEAKQLLRDLLQLSDSKSSVVSSADIYPLLERTQSSVILALHYGFRVPTVDDPLFHRIMETQAKATHVAANPGLPDIFPFLRHLPAFISPWHKAADKIFQEQKEVYLYLLELGDKSLGWNATKQARAAAAKYSKEPVPDIDLAYNLATSVQGGMETSPRALLWLFAAAVAANKDFIKRAQAELDAVIGRDRLPRFSDRSSLAYIDAIVAELMRWRPVSPGGIPRRADEQDDYQGIKIVKNATVVANAWSIGRDAAAFDPTLGDLEEFVPERWLDGDQMKTSLPIPVFGQGRRSCQGKRVALDGGFANVAAMIWAFDFEMMEEVDCMDMEAIWVMVQPKQFTFKLKPRGSWVASVVEAEWESADKDLGNIMGKPEDLEG